MYSPKPVNPVSMVLATEKLLSVPGKLPLDRLDS